MAAVASQPPWHPYKFGQHPRPEASPEPFIPPRPINFPGSRANHAPADRFPSPERPFYASNDSSEFDRAAFGQYPESGHRPAYPPPNRPDPPPDRPDPPLTRNKHVTFSTPSGGYYTTNTSPTNPTLQNGDPHRSGSVWSRISDRFRGVSRAMEARPDNPTIPQSSGLNREQQIQQVLALLLPYVPAAEPMIRPMIDLIHDSQLLQQLIDTLNRPLTQQQFLEIQDSFTIPADEQAEFVKMLSNPDDPGIPTLLAQFKEFVEYISGRPIPSTSDSCSLRSCCSDVRAMAIFEHLSVFDEDYLTRVRNFHHGAADAHTNANRLSFLTHAFDPANRRDPRYRGFIYVLKRTLKYVRFWLEPGVPQNVACTSVAQMLAASFLLEVVRAFLSKGIQTITQFRARGHLIRRIMAFLLTLSWQRSGPLYDLVGKSPVVIDQSPGLRCLIWVSGSVWEGHFSPDEDPVILEHMRDLWTCLENEAGSEALRGVANEINTGLYERGRDLSLFQRS
ncbi:hypothetical protein C0989_008157 [Termitomyces sp. Mn162]|nr:hypothetical protein C0989_008157 [Termitomyces sp. Mn162]